MPQIFLSKHFEKATKKFVKNNLRHLQLLKKAMSLFSENPIHPNLNLEKLRGSKNWSIRLDEGNRILFEWLDKDTVFFIDLGPHDMYRNY
jgi:plasmid maintenance system killer protein